VQFKWQCSTLPLHRVSHYSKNSSHKKGPKITTLHIKQSRGRNCVVYNIQNGGTNIVLAHIRPWQKDARPNRASYGLGSE